MLVQEKEILAAYPWLNSELFARIILQDYPNATAAGVAVEKFSVAAALAPGENYASQMIRSSVTYNIDGASFEKRFIIKAMLMRKEVRDMITKENLFAKEIRMYTEILPALEKLLVSIGDDTKFSAKCYDASDEEQYIIFEDLAERGFKNRDRRLGLDMVHYKQALTKIAKYHACTAILYTGGYDFENMKQSVVTLEMFHHLTLNSIRGAVEATKNMPKRRHLSEKLRKASETIKEKIFEAIKFKDHDFITLCHGDLWMNNIMFKFDKDANPIDTILVDYQIPYVGPAVIDVINTLYTSSDESLRDREWDLLVQHYHTCLSATLKKLNYTKPIPTLTGIQLQILEKGICYASMALMSPGMRNLENTGEDMTMFFGDPMKLAAIIGGAKGMKTLEFLLDYFDRKGYFG